MDHEAFEDGAATAPRGWKRAARVIEGGLRWRVAGKPQLRLNAARAMKGLGAGIGYAVFVEPRWIEATHVEVSIPGLAPALDGYRIAHVTDVHHNVVSGRGFIERAVAQTNALDADLVALTGDFVTHNAARLEPCLAMLSRLRAPDGLFVVRGNHDHLATEHEFREACARAGMRLLENEHVVVRPARARVRRASEHNGGAPAGELVVAGVGDLWKGVCAPARALEGAPDGPPRLLLAHNPMTAELVEPRLKVILQLSGHTHGGQIRPFKRPVQAFGGGAGKYMAGMAEGPGCLVYTSRGVGASAFHARWNCRPEIALVTLRAERAAQ